MISDFNLRLILTLFFLFSFFIHADAQQMNQDYKTSSIYLKGTKYVKNGVSYKRGLFDKHLIEELKVSPNAIIEVDKFKKK